MRNRLGTSVITGLTLRATGLYFFFAFAKMGTGVVEATVRGLGDLVESKGGDGEVAK
jgi:hypothetical protein